MKRSFFYGLLLFYSVNTYSQMHVSIEYECMYQNSAILSEALLDIFGEDTISHWLDENAHMVLSCNVDSFGIVHDVVNFHDYSIRLSYEQKQMIEAYLCKKKITFAICYAKEPGLSLDSLRTELRKSFTQIPYMYIGGVGFPGQIYYEMEWGNQNVPKINILKQMIHKVLYSDNK